VITYNFAGIESDAGEISGQVGKVAGLLAEGHGALTRLQAVWTGDGQMAYDAVQNRWNQNSEELNLALQSLSEALSRSGGDMFGADQGVAGQFT
jgi:early secretory antigenic target protein ESAT-6